MPNYSQGAQGAAGGAMTGAALGTMVLPGWGTAIGAAGGAIVGGVAGLFGDSGGPKYDEELRKRLFELEKEYAIRAAPQVNATGAQNSEFRTNQQALVGQLEAMGRGQGPSAAALQMREASDRIAGTQASLAGGAIGRGVNAGAANRAAANNASQGQAQVARDTGLARVNEQLGAINQLGLTLHGARGADETTNRFNAAQMNEVALANAQNQLNQQALNDRSQLQALAGAGGSLQAMAPGTGSQILAGGASAFPGMMQMVGAGMQKGAAPQAAPAPAAQAGQRMAAAPLPPPTWNFDPYAGTNGLYGNYNPYGPQPTDPRTAPPSVLWG